MSKQGKIIIDLLKREPKKRIRRNSRILKGWLKYPDGLENDGFERKQRLLYKHYCGLENMATFDQASFNIKGDVFYYFFEDAERIMGTPYANLEHQSETFPAYCLTRWKYENPQIKSYFDDIDEDDVIYPDFNLELVKRGYKVGGSSLGGHEKDFKHLPRIFPDFGKRLVVVTAMTYVGAGNDHWYVKMEVQSNDFYEIDDDKKVVKLTNPWDNSDEAYSLEEKFNTSKDAFDWVEKMKAEKFPEDEYIVVRGTDPITKHFYRKEGD